jgi:hypothetical protein
MSHGSSVLHKPASALFAYAAPEIERSRLLLEERCKSFEGSSKHLLMSFGLLSKHLLRKAEELFAEKAKRHEKLRLRGMSSWNLGKKKASAAGT